MFLKWRHKLLFKGDKIIYFESQQHQEVRVGEGQRERETQNLKWAPGSELSAQSRMWGSNSWTTRSWLELKLDGQLTNWATQVPYVALIFTFKFYLFIYLFVCLFIFTFIYFWDRERQSMNGGVSEREGDTESETGSRLWAISPEPDTGLELPDREIVTWLKLDA